MNTQTTTLAEFIETNALTFSMKQKASNPHFKGDPHLTRHFLCYIGKPGMIQDDQMHVPFSQGSAHTKPPTLEDVLDCLASDSAGVENARSFEDWAAEYGYDTDSRKAEKTYCLCRDQAEQLKALLGPDSYAQLLWNVERL